MSVGDTKTWHFTASGLPNLADLDKAIALKLEYWKIVTGVDIPYCAGYNVKGDTIYIDKDVPEFWEWKGRRLEIWRGSLFQHESSEKVDMMFYADERYPGAHTMATYWENAYVAANGFDQDAYENEFWAPIIAKVAARKHYDRVPHDLDLTPYHEEGDGKLLKRCTFVDVSK
jgi:hypothetical protein